MVVTYSRNIVPIFWCFVAWCVHVGKRAATNDVRDVRGLSDFGI
jgi:hypothetical protein